MKKAIVVFASGSGSNFKNIVKKIKIQNIDAEVNLLVSNNSNCQAILFAKKQNIETFIYNFKKYPNDTNQDILLQKLKTSKADLIVLAGYLKKISKHIIKNYKNKILNIHPSLLPKYGGKGFYGMRVHEAVYANKDKKTGATVHFVNEDYDTGPILIQKEINLSLNEKPLKIAEKVLKIEHEIYFKSISLFCKDKILWSKNKPHIKEK